MANQSQAKASLLCLSCGLCCDGSIFSYVELDEADCENLGSSAGGEKRLSLPCIHLDERRCTVYSRRPRTCANYRCKTLDALKREELSFEDAKETILKGAALGREFHNAIPPGISRQQAIICVAKDQCPKEASEREFLQMRLSYVALQAFVDRHMRRKGENVVSTRMNGPS